MFEKKGKGNLYKGIRSGGEPRRSGGAPRRRGFALLLAASLLIGALSHAGLFLSPAAVWAAPLTSPVKNFIDRRGNDAVSLRVDWQSASLYGVKAARAVWVESGAGGLPVQKAGPVYNDPILDTDGNPTGDFREITQIVISVPDNGFQYDILYQIRIDFYDIAAPDPLVDAPRPEFGETVFLRGITVGARDIASRDYRSEKPGEREAGHKPAVEVTWRMPRVYVNAPADGGPYAANAASGAFLRVFAEDPATPAGAGYAAALAAVRKLNPSVTEFLLVLGLENFIVQTNTFVPLQEIWLEPDASAPNFLAAEVDFRGGETYRAAVDKVSGGGGSGAAPDDWYRIYLSGRLNSNVALPDDAVFYDPAQNTRFLPSEIPTAKLPSVLRHKDLYPGATYRFHAELHYRSAGGADEREIVGSGFEVVGERLQRDIDTALRIIVSKISDEYV
ncbi:MAG: hypothetical protein LBU58_00660, partial [Clostridiales bacterium]|nr:hypothetical protein [Clostridiales bacterium]